MRLLEIVADAGHTGTLRSIAEQHEVPPYWWAAGAAEERRGLPLPGTGHQGPGGLGCLHQPLGAATKAPAPALPGGPGRRDPRAVRRALDERIAAALSGTQIPNPQRVMQSFPHELSGGMGQRVMIAQALACDPDLIIADEPTGNLDGSTGEQIIDLLFEVHQKYQTTLFLITHDEALAGKCERIVRLRDGRSVEGPGVAGPS